MKARVIWICWAATLAFALVLALPLAALLQADLGHSLTEPGIEWLVEFYAATRGWPPLWLAPAAAVVAALYAVLAAFLTGGIISVTGMQIPKFWTAAGRYVGAMLRLLLLSAVAYGLVLLASGGLGQLGRHLLSQSMEERPLVLFSWFRAGLTLLALLGVGMVFDYARIRLVVEDSRSATRSLVGAVGFVLRHPRKTCALYGAFWLALAGASGLYLVLSRIVPRTALGWISLAFLVQQTFVWLRCAWRVWFLGSQSALYRRLNLGISIPVTEIREN
jgi:hypothetical protein